VPEHVRTYVWNDSSLRPDADGTRTGLEVMRAAAEKRSRSPIMETLGLDLVEVDEGRAVLTCEPEPFLANQVGVLHGGVASTLLDSAASAALHTTLGPGDSYATVSLTATYCRPVLPGSGLMRCEGVVLNAGRTLAVTTAELRDGRGKLLSHAVVNLFVTRDQ
jgi:uncharacterized protein (TIGR00369 family)